jgi:hypothetical protein
VPVHLSPVARPTGQHRTDAKRPAWILLYALVPLCVALLVLVDNLPSSGAWHALAQGVIVLLVVGLAAAWVRGNRRALSQVQSDSEVETGLRDLTIEVHDASPRVIHLEPRRSRSDT